jgi:predicted RNA-binding Zn ribbon-like protein
MSGEPSPSVRLVRDFVNSAEPQLGTDQLAPSTAQECLERLGLLTPGAGVATEDLSLLVGVREGLRGLLLEHVGHDVSPSRSSDDLDHLLRTVPLIVSLAGATPVATAAQDDVAHRVVAMVVSAVIAAPPEEWQRLKVCARHSCHWAFFDSSRNRSGRWCSMAGCGNIVKMRRAYRTRTQPRTSPGGNQDGAPVDASRPS